MNSKEKLAQALEEYKGSLKIDEVKNMPFHFIDTMIARAKEGYYSDYDSPLALPCIELVRDLEKIQATGLSIRAKNGEFDAIKEESDAWYEREGKAMIENELPPSMHHLFTPKSKEETEAKEGIKGWDY